MKKLQYYCIICFIALCITCDISTKKLFLINNTNDL